MRLLYHENEKTREESRVFSQVLIAELHANEPSDAHVLTDRHDILVHELADRLILVFNKLLVEETRLFVELRKLAVDDFFDDLRGLAFGGKLFTVDALLAFDRLGRNVVA